jgi:hypothetical protein
MSLFKKKKQKCKHHFHEVEDSERLILYPHPEGCTEEPWVSRNKNGPTLCGSVDIISEYKCCKCSYGEMRIDQYNPLGFSILEMNKYETIKLPKIIDYCNSSGYESFEK